MAVQGSFGGNLGVCCQAESGGFTKARTLDRAKEKLTHPHTDKRTIPFIRLKLRSKQAV